LVKRRRVAVRGPHGLGKTALAAWAVLWGLGTFGQDAKIVTTASAWRQLTKYLWPEIRKWAARWKASGLLMQTLNAYQGQAEAFAVASDNPAYIEGAHAAKLLYVLDEAKAIPDATWDAVEGSFSHGECYALAISTPGDRAGRFYDIHRRAPGYLDWWVRHVTLDEAVAAGRIAPEWAAARLTQWGAQSPLYQARVLGEFPEQSEDALISLAWIERAAQRGLELESPSAEGETFCGQDVARYGSDDSANVSRRGPVVFRYEVWSGHDTMYTAGRARAIALETNAKNVNVDVIGVGAGVFDRMREVEDESDVPSRSFSVGAVNVGERARDAERFANLRAELWWGLRERFEKDEIILMPSLLLDRLSGELTSIKYKPNSRGQIVIESKDDLKARGLPSPDVAEALMLAFAPSWNPADLIGW